MQAAAQSETSATSAALPVLTLTRKEAAKELKISQSMLDLLTRAGKIAVCKVGRRRLYRPEALSAYLDQIESTRHRVLHGLWDRRNRHKPEQLISQAPLNEGASSEVDSGRNIPSPAANAELILDLLLKDDEAEAICGDLKERYPKKVERLGKRRAYIWFWGEVLRSIWPLVKRFFTASGFLAAAEFIRILLS